MFPNMASCKIQKKKTLVSPLSAVADLPCLSSPQLLEIHYGFRNLLPEEAIFIKDMRFFNSIIKPGPM